MGMAVMRIRQMVMAVGDRVMLVFMGMFPHYGVFMLVSVMPVIMGMHMVMHKRLV